MRYALDLVLKTLACILLAGILLMQMRIYKSSETLLSVISTDGKQARIEIAQPIEVVGFSNPYMPELPKADGEPVKVRIVSDW